MESEWEEKYWDLIGKIAAEHEEEERRLKKYLPHFFVLCDDNEKKKALKKVHERIVDDEWIGNSSVNGGRPMFVMETVESKKKIARANRTARRSSGGKRQTHESIDHGHPRVNVGSWKTSNGTKKSRQSYLSFWRLFGHGSC